MPVEGSGLPRNFMRPCLLLLLREQSAHGYELIERLGAFGLNGDPGGVYRALRALEKEGLVRSAWQPSDSGPQRRIYALTRRGMEELHNQAKALSATERALDLFLTRFEEFVALERGPRRPQRAGVPS